MDKLDKDSEKAASEAMTEMANSLQKKETSFNRWKCMECADEPVFEQNDFVSHLKEVHQINPGTSGTQTMRMHLDGRDWYQTDYDVELGGKHFVHSVRNKRNKRTRLY